MYCLKIIRKIKNGSRMELIESSRTLKPHFRQQVINVSCVVATWRKEEKLCLLNAAHEPVRGQ